MAKIKFNTLYTTLAVLALLGSALAQQPPAKSPTPAPTKTPPASTPKTKPSAEPKAAPALVTEKDKVSYAIGLSVGTGLHDSISRQAIDVDSKILLQGFQDALSGGKTQMTADEARALLMQFQTEMRAKQEEKMKVAAEANKKEGEAFLAANKTKEGVTTLPSGLQYKVLTKGTGPKPTAEDIVVVNYRGTLINGTEFDSSAKHGAPAPYPVNKYIKGWTEALQLMPVGSKWQLFVPADLAYGPRQPSPEIGPNSTLIFEVELLSIQEKEKPAAPAPTPKPAPTPEKK
jgi:FKBP-type peptidyl-prolyl cis-trans isomerase